jgi:hypothetical protein
MEVGVEVEEPVQGENDNGHRVCDGKVIRSAIELMT